MPGEIAEMMLEGILCQGCGEYIGEGEGFPGFCEGCRPGREQPRYDSRVGRAERKHRIATTSEPRCCLFCGKKFGSLRGVTDHMRGRHLATFTWERLP